MRRNTSWAFIGNSIYAGCQWAVFVLLARTLELDAVGSFAYATAVSGPIFVLTNLRLSNLLATGTKSPGGFSDYLAARGLTTAIGVLASLAIGACISPREGSFMVLAVMTVGRACDAMSDICHGLFQRELDMRSAAIGLAINGLFSMALVAVALAASHTLIVATAGYAAASGLALVGWSLPRASRLARGGHVRAAGTHAVEPAARLIVMALPIGLSSALGSVQSSLPRYVIALYIGPAALAVFAAISYVTMLGHLVVNAISQAALPVLARDARTSPRQYQTRLYRLVAASVGFGAIGLTATVMFGQPLLRSVYGEAYAQHADVLLWLVAAAVVTFTSVFLGTGTTARRRFGAQLMISATSLAVVAGSIGPLVGRHGLKGAAWSLLAGSLVELGAYMTVTMLDFRAGEPWHHQVSEAMAGGVHT
jgi:O-antigen/teichoic acid export membrane protein